MRAFIYKEIHSRTLESDKPVMYYVISSEHNTRRGCCRTESTEESHIMEEILRKKTSGVTIVSKLPPKIHSIEERTYISPKRFSATIRREPYYLLQTFAGYKGNK